MCINCVKRAKNEVFGHFLKFDWPDQFDIAYIDVAQSDTYDLANLHGSSMIDHKLSQVQGQSKSQSQ